MTSTLPLVALGIALGDVDHGVIEEGNNTGPRIRAYLKHAGITVPAPWCAAAVTYWSDIAAEALDVPNPLDAVKLEAYVPSFHEWAKSEDRIVDVALAQPGDLILYKFGGKRWDHIGIVLRPLKNGRIAAVEGNTGPGIGSSVDEREREGDGVYAKLRTIGRQPIEIVRWA